MSHRPTRALLMAAVAAACAGQAQEYAPKVWICRKDAWVLGERPEQWKRLAGHLGGIKLYIDEIQRAEPAELRRFAEVINAREIPIAVECAGLCDWRAKDGDRAAEMSFRDEFRKVKRYLDAGGRVAALQLDGPVRRTLYRRGDRGPEPNAGQTLDSAVAELVEVMSLWRAAVPEIEFHLLTNFPHWGYRDAPAYHAWPDTGQGRLGWGDYDRVLRAVLPAVRAADLPLTGITVDNPYDYITGRFRSNQPAVTRDTDWLQRVRDLEDFVHDQGLAFNLIVNSGRAGAEKGGSDEVYSSETMAYVDLYLGAGGRPDALTVQSWYHYPSAYLPESRPGVLAHLAQQVVDALADAP